jgi:probable DNA metabolism protein
VTVYRYDGSFDGLLSAFAEALACEPEPPDFVPAATADGLLFMGRDIPVRPDAAAGFLARLQAAGSEGAVRTLATAFLAEIPGIERALYEYCLMTLSRGECVDGWHSHPAVGRVTAAARRVGGEVHRFQGLLRFGETSDGFYYAPYEPDHNITIPLGRHFAVRLRDQRWIIHDRRRDLAVLWDGEHLQPASLAPPPGTSADAGPALSAAEQEVQSLWRTYHRRIAIDSRRNPKLQRQCMPARYWRYLVEMQASCRPG